MSADNKFFVEIAFISGRVVFAGYPDESARDALLAAYQTFLASGNPFFIVFQRSEVSEAGVGPKPSGVARFDRIDYIISISAEEHAAKTKPQEQRGW